MKKFSYPHKIFLALLAVMLVVFILSSVSFAPTKLMSDADLSDVDGQALFSIVQFTNATYSLSNTGGALAPGTGSQNIIRLNLGLDVQMFGLAKSQKLGYYDDGSHGSGWDIDQTNLSMGSADHTTSPLTMNGVYLEFGFDNINNNATRVLNYIDVGTMHASGKITATINTINTLASNNGTGQNNGVLLRATGSGTRTIHFSNEVLSFLFATKYRYTDNSGNGTNVSGIFMKLPNYNTNNTT
jgi:hypothetical protein